MRMLAGLCVMLIAGICYAGEQGKPAEVPKEAAGFSGKIEGTVTNFKANGNWVAVKVTKAEPDAKSTVKDGAAVVGKEIAVKVRFDKQNGQNSEDTTFVKGLKAGDAIQLVVNYVASQNAMAMVELPKKSEAAK